MQAYALHPQPYVFSCSVHAISYISSSLIDSQLTNVIALMHWCWWQPDKLGMDIAYSIILLKYSYISVFSLNSKCVLNVVQLLFETTFSSASLWLCTKLCCFIINHYKQYMCEQMYSQVNKRIYWMPVLLEVYFRSMTEIKWHAPSAVFFVTFSMKPVKGETDLFIY